MRHKTVIQIQTKRTAEESAVPFLYISDRCIGDTFLPGVFHGRGSGMDEKPDAAAVAEGIRLNGNYGFRNGNGYQVFASGKRVLPDIAHIFRYLNLLQASAAFESIVGEVIYTVRDLNKFQLPAVPESPLSTVFTPSVFSIRYTRARGNSSTIKRKRVLNRAHHY